MGGDSMERSLPQLVTALQTGELSLRAYLAQVAAHFAQREPAIQAFVPEAGRWERLEREGAALQARYPDPTTRPPLFGALMGVKDIFRVDGFVTRAGAQLPPVLWQGAEAPVVTRLQQAGALILGKTVTTEFAYFAPGPTRNPHRLDHTPGGSSSGSAAAVAAGFCPLALGTQTIGSLSRPAAFCGVAAYKPSYDRLPRDGVIPLSPSLDHVGWLATDGASAAWAAAVAVADWQAIPQPPRPRLALPEGPYLEQLEPAGREHFQAVVMHLIRAGWMILSLSAMPDFAAIVARHHALMAAECAAVHEAWDAAYAELYHPQTRALIERGRAVPPAEVVAARAGRDQLRQTLMGLMEQYGVDLWLCPAATGPAPAGLASTGNPIMNLPWSHSGLPTLALPAGTWDGLPMGVQLVGRWYQDERLMAQAALLEPDLRHPALRL